VREGPLKREELWRSLEERIDAPAFRERLREQYPHLAAMALQPASRRGFLKLLGASLTMAGLAGCRRPEEPIVPHASRPEDREPGVPERYATAMDLGGAGLGLLVTSVDGRPIKVEGNPDHPASLGGTSAIAQAAILELYDPERSTSVVQRDGGNRQERSWADWTSFADKHFGSLRGTSGRGLAVLVEESSSHGLERLRFEFTRTFPEGRWVEYSPVSRDAARDGGRQALVENYRTQLHLEQCRVLVSLDADLLVHHPQAVVNARALAKARHPDAEVMNRTYAVESAYSLTGAMADHRLPLRPSQVAPFAASLLGALLHAADRGAAWRQLAGVVGTPAAPEGTAEIRDRMVHDILEHPEQSLIAVGVEQPAPLHALVAAVNVLLGTTGHTITYDLHADPRVPSHLEALGELADAMGAGQVDTLLVLGGNPVHDAPADLAFGERLQAVDTAVHLGLYEDETSELCGWHLPRAHFLESWCDATAFDGTQAVVQPLIAPLYDGKTAIEVLAGVLAGDLPPGGRDLVRWALGSTDDATWHQTLHDGVVPRDFQPIPSFPALTARDETGAEVGLLPGIRGRLVDAWKKLQTSLGGPADGLELQLRPDTRIYDGRFANNGWLQELPDPLTKVTWDNPVLVSPADAERLDLSTNDVVTVGSGDRSVEAVAYVMPGQAEGCVSATLGYGRRAVGEVGNGVGTDFYALRTTDAMHHQAGVTLERTGRTHDLACTQDHYPLDPIGESGMERRLGDLYRSAHLDDYHHHPDFAQHVVHHPPLDQQWKPHEYPGHRWAMTVDLSACTGCNTCAVACQAENNIAVVGREQVEKGREMAWLRIDRYFRGDPDAPSVALMPVTCHHCENAPCEQVCPVAATVHDHEGLNVMVYNRCVGTRYCSNNCPYKVRRFNFFKYMDPETDVEKMRFNPEVTVRSRGVMEKCSFCVQRINTARIAAENEGRTLKDGDVVPACAQACPSGAVVFGDLNDPESRIAKLFADPRSYAMLGEMNNRPRLQYLAKVDNPATDGEAVAHDEVHGEVEGDHGGDPGGHH